MQIYCMVNTTPKEHSGTLKSSLKKNRERETETMVLLRSAERPSGWINTDRELIEQLKFMT